MSIEIRTFPVEQIELSCPMTDRQKALDYLSDNGYHILRAGPKMIGDYRFDSNVFHAKGEKIVGPVKTISV